MVSLSLDLVTINGITYEYHQHWVALGGLGTDYWLLGMEKYYSALG